MLSRERRTDSQYIFLALEQNIPVCRHLHKMRVILCQLFKKIRLAFVPEDYPFQRHGLSRRQLHRVRMEQKAAPVIALAEEVALDTVPGEAPLGEDHAQVGRFAAQLYARHKILLQKRVDAQCPPALDGCTPC